MQFLCHWHGDANVRSSGSGTVQDLSPAWTDALEAATAALAAGWVVAAGDDDLVTIDLKATRGGEDVEGGEVSGFSYKVGSGDIAKKVKLR